MLVRTANIEFKLPFSPSTQKLTISASNVRGVPLGMSKIHPEWLALDHFAAHTRFREEPDEEDEEEEDNGEGKGDGEEGDEEDDEGYSP